jgi:hypothetical protein
MDTPPANGYPFASAWTNRKRQEATFAGPGSVSEFLSPSEVFLIIMVSVFDFRSRSATQVSGFRTRFEVFAGSFRSSGNYFAKHARKSSTSVMIFYCRVRSPHSLFSGVSLRISPRHEAGNAQRSQALRCKWVFVGALWKRRLTFGDSANRVSQDSIVTSTISVRFSPYVYGSIATASESWDNLPRASKGGTGDG